MSTHTTHFCDRCNDDRTSTGDDDGHAVNYSEFPTYDGWAEFQKPYTSTLDGRQRMSDYHVCAHCLADPDFDPDYYGTIPDWDKESQTSLEKGRKHAAAFSWALEHLGTRDRWGWRGVRQVFGSAGYGYWVGPKMADGQFCLSDRIPAPRAA